MPINEVNLFIILQIAVPTTFSSRLLFFVQEETKLLQLNRLSISSDFCFNIHITFNTPRTCTCRILFLDFQKFSRSQLIIISMIAFMISKTKTEPILNKLQIVKLEEIVILC